jgi:hypothetical protein
MLWKSIVESGAMNWLTSFVDESFKHYRFITRFNLLVFNSLGKPPETFYLDEVFMKRISLLLSDVMFFYGGPKIENLKIVLFQFREIYFLRNKVKRRSFDFMRLLGSEEIELEKVIDDRRFESVLRLPGEFDRFFSSRDEFIRILHCLEIPKKIHAAVILGFLAEVAIILYNCKTLQESDFVDISDKLGQFKDLISKLQVNKLFEGVLDEKTLSSIEQIPFQFISSDELVSLGSQIAVSV